MEILDLPLVCLSQIISYLNTNDVLNLLIATYKIQPNQIKSTSFSDIIFNQKYSKFCLLCLSSA